MIDTRGALSANRLSAKAPGAPGSHIGVPGTSICAFLLLFCITTPAVAEILFTPRLSVGTSYSDNVFLEPDDTDSDLITFVSPAFDLNVTGRNSGIGIAYDPVYLNYTKFPQNTYWRQGLNLDGWVDVTRGTRLELTNDYRYTSEAISETDTTVRQGREPYTTNTATVGVVNQFGAKDVVELRYTSYVLENDDETIEDSAYHQPTLLFTYWFIPRRFAIEVEGEYTISDFDVSEDFEDLDATVRLIRQISRHLQGYLEYNHLRFDYQNETEDYRVYSPRVGFDYAERADTRLGASFGYFYRDNDISESDDGIVGTLEMEYGYAPGSSFSVDGSVGYDTAFFGAENLGFNPYYEVGGNLTHLLTRRLSGTLEAGYRRNLYIDEEPDREDALWTAGAGLAYRALPWLTVQGAYRYRQVNSSIDANDYIENMGMLFVTLSPQRPLRF